MRPPARSHTEFNTRSTPLTPRRTAIRLAWLVALLLFPSLQGARAQTATEFWLRQHTGIHQALTNPTISSRVQTIWMQLARYSGRMYPVYPAQQFTMGQALPSGAILLDLGVAGDHRPEVTAFWLAHEYAHQVLGHPQLIASAIGPWVLATSGTQTEDSADAWAGRFLRARGYDVRPVLSFLCSMPDSGNPRDTHSTSAVRARTVAAAYGAGASHPCGRPACRTVTTYNDQTVWETQYVPQQVACTHCWQTVWGYQCTHPYDVVRIPGQVPTTRRVPVTRQVCD